MTDHTEINRYLTKAMGEKWHTIVETSWRKTGWVSVKARWWKCSCGYEGFNNIVIEHLSKVNSDFFTADGFFKLWNWAKEQGWWDDFAYGTCCCGINNPYIEDWRLDNLVNKDTFATEVYEFLEGREEQ